ncbi:hypothetical protein D3C72_908560 [compost metagenome]
MPLYLPACFKCRPRRHSLQTIAVEWAYSFEFILWMASDQYMTPFRMNQPMNQPAFCIYTHAHASTDGIVDTAVQPLSCPPFRFTKCSCIHIRIPAVRYREELLQLTEKIIICPTRLRGGCHISISRTGWIKINRSEGTDPHRFDLLVFKVSYDAVQGLFRSFRRETYTVFDDSFFIADPTDEFRPPGFNRTYTHTIYLLL